MKHKIIATVLLASVTAPRFAHADPTPEPQTQAPVERTEAPPPAGTRSATNDEAACEGELAEFERQYARAPAPGTLYDIGVCAEQTGDFVRAAASLKHYLTEGGSTIRDERRAKVASTLARVEPRIARVTILSNLDGVEVRVDGNCAIDGTTYEPTCASRGESRVVLMNPGQRRLSMKHVGFQDEARVLTVNSGDQMRVLLNATSFTQKENPFREPMWTAWAVTGGAALGTGIVGVRTALIPEGFESSVGVATIALGIGTVIAAGVATYFTVRNSRWKPNSDVGIAADVLGLRARF